jgi:hypothetical protein
MTCLVAQTGILNYNNWPPCCPWSNRCSLFLFQVWYRKWSHGPPGRACRKPLAGWQMSMEHWWNSGLRGSSKLLWVKTCSRASVHSLDCLQADRWCLTVHMTFRTSHVSEYLKIDLRCWAVSPLRRAWNRQDPPPLTDFVHRVVIVYILKAL